MKRLKKCLSLILAIAVCMSTFFASTTSLEVMAARENERNTHISSRRRRLHGYNKTV